MEPRDNGGILSAIAGGVAMAASGVGAAAGAIMANGEIAAMTREAIKDVRSMVHETYFGQPEGMCEPGTPLNPTQGEIAADRRPDVPLPGDIAQDNTPYVPDQGQTQETVWGR